MDNLTTINNTMLTGFWNRRRPKQRIKLYLFKKLWLWWINDSYGRELRGTYMSDKITDMIFRD